MRATNERSADAGVGARYGAVAITLHWLIAVILVGQILFGWYLEGIARGTPARGWYVNLHKSIGMTLGLLIAFRVFWRWSHGPPTLPSWMPAWQRIGARVSHTALYACMLAMPLTGYIASNFSKWGVNYFNVIMLQPWGVDDKQIYAFFNGAHIATSYAFVTLIVIHVLSALRHALARDRVFMRMWPGSGAA